MSAEAATAQADATAARAAEREATATIVVKTREAAASRSEVTRLERELEKLRAACAQKVGRGGSGERPSGVVLFKDETRRTVHYLVLSSYKAIVLSLCCHFLCIRILNSEW